MDVASTDKIKVICPQCKKEFKERAQKIRGDAKLPCPNCGEEVVFDNASSDPAIKKALSLARKLRRQATGN